MSQSKKIFTRMCLNNWGGINHKVLQFNEYVNLFSGKSGSGKSTVMDAIQVILYGSFSPTFLNKAADDAKNRRSVLSYLRGEQKDGSANRGDCDFCSVIALEIEDTGSHTFTCIGIAFEVRKNDSEIKRFVYFTIYILYSFTIYNMTHIEIAIIVYILIKTTIRRRLMTKRHF